ncbi:MAG: class I SAM-dependent methyltransferase [Oscillospiraceae bacterium]|nr:class I SAM-dependent methyltransferase [Oscillospiraceae bacterium]
MNSMFLCPKCKSEFDLPKCPVCGYEVTQINTIYQFCDDPSVKLEGYNQYIGYDGIGEDFEPAVKFWDTNDVERYGVYEACGDLIVQRFGRDITVLDLGAGLGTASIPLAKNGIYTIAADISNVMLSTAVKRAAGRYDNLVFARMNAYNLMIADNRVDIIVENAMLHLVDNPEKVIKEIVRVLKPAGHLIRYGSYSQPLSEEEAKQNALCNNILSDINGVFYNYLTAHGFKSIWFYNRFAEIIPQYFDVPINNIANGFSEVFTEKLKFRLHRLKTGAHSDLQNIPKELINTAWSTADKYARDKYGDDYINIKGFSRYGTAIDIYKAK